MDEPSKPLTGLAWASGQSTCPKGHIMIVASSEGASANFVKGFNQKSAVYLCYSTAPETFDQVITDVVLVNEKSPLPVGYAYISEYIDPKVTVSKKKRLCVKLLPLNSADTVVCDVKLTTKNKQLGAPYTRIGEMSGLALWCKKVSSAILRPVPKPRNITTGIRGLSLDQSSQAQPSNSDVTPNLPSAATLSKTSGRTALSENTIYESSNIYGISAIDGIPFTIHPMFENQVKNPVMNSSGFTDFRIKTLADIENEYNYGFVVERSAAVR
ncbi:multivesicular body subunit 12A [Pelobates fuscus]|uniref:multivesicular body subunit 12A n=1 Tax=Pelobates fuscus TaxID=191477 RepID=UPI002FE4B4CF